MKKNNLKQHLLAAVLMVMIGWSPVLLMSQESELGNSKPKGRVIPIGETTIEKGHTTQESVMGKKNKLWYTTITVLENEGYELDKISKKEGTIQTRIKNLKLDTSYCVYGSSSGPQYPLSDDAITYVNLNFKIDNNNIAIRTEIEVARQVGDQEEILDMVCVSRGKLEKKLLEKIRAAVDESSPKKEMVK